MNKRKGNRRNYSKKNGKGSGLREEIRTGCERRRKRKYVETLNENRRGKKYKKRGKGDGKVDGKESREGRE